MIRTQRTKWTNENKLARSRNAVKLIANERKLHFKLKAVGFHGHTMSSESLKIEEEKRAVLEMPRPRR